MQNDARNQHEFTSAEADELRETAIRLSEFTQTAPFGATLTYDQMMHYHRELGRCFAHSWNYAIQWLKDNGHKNDADALKAAEKDAQACSRRAYLAVEPGGRGVWPDNLRVKITSLVRKIEAVVKKLTPESADAEQPPNEISIENIVLTDYDRTVLEEIAGNPTTTTQAYLQKHLPGQRAASPDAKTVRAATDGLLRLGLVYYPYPEAKHKGIALTARGRALYERYLNELLR